MIKSLNTAITCGPDPVRTRPPATLPSGSATAHPRFSARLPLGTLALFLPIRPGRF